MDGRLLHCLFLLLTSRLVTATILAFPDFSKSFILDADASDQRIGAVNLQKINRKKHAFNESFTFFMI